MLTDRSIRNLKPQKHAYRERDKNKALEYRGFCVRVTPAGAKTFQVEYTFEGSRRFLNLGSYPMISLETARERCRDARGLLSDGTDPQLEQRRKKQAEEAERGRLKKEADLALATATFSDLAKVYLSSLSNQNTRAYVADVFDRDVMPVIGNCLLPDITDQMVRTILAKIHRRGAHRVMGLVYTYLHAAFEMARRIPKDPTITTEKIFPPIENPLASITKPDKAMPADRHLKEDEIRAIWKAVADQNLSPQTQAALTLLLITGQRVQEVVGMQWKELDFKRSTWQIPANRIKTGRKRPVAHMVPLPLLAVRILRQLPRIGPCVFPKTGNPNEPMPWRSLSQAATRLAVAAEIEQFSPRDLRRTVKTHMARLRIAKPIRDMVQNHALGDVSSVHYDRWDGYPEKREALHSWTRDLLRIVNT